jgi:hypothetical protein
MRWENYFLRTDKAFFEFWTEYLREKRDILYIMGLGFDPRTVVMVESIYGIKGTGLRDTMVIRYFVNEKDKVTPNHTLVEGNIRRLNSLITTSSYNSYIQKDVVFRSPDDNSITAVNSGAIISSIDELESYSDIVVDISAMPRSVFIPLLTKLLMLIDSHNEKGNGIKNLHVVVAENPSLDGKIHDNGIDEEASFIHSVRAKEGAKYEDQKEVWIPILGENQEEQFDKIRKKLSPVETCPILPFPSENLRRGDNLINRYGELLFNDADFETKNIVYADEGNPFHVYRLLTRTIERYNRSFELLNGCRIVVSALSSKLLTIGAFLAVIEEKSAGRNVGIMHVESLEHELDDDYEEVKIEVEKNNKLFEIWLAGEPYIPRK